MPVWPKLPAISCYWLILLHTYVRICTSRCICQMHADVPTLPTCCVSAWVNLTMWVQYARTYTWCSLPGGLQKQTDCQGSCYHRAECLMYMSIDSDSHYLQGRAAEGILFHHLNAVEGEHAATHTQHNKGWGGSSVKFGNEHLVRTTPRIFTII